MAYSISIAKLLFAYLALKLLTTMISKFIVFFILKCRYGIFVDSFVICPYCDPNHMAYPNMEEAVRGYDVPMGNPNPGRGDSDPGIRNQIFNPMVRNR